MSLNIIELYRDYSVTFVTEGHKHTARGWVNVSCPFCTGNPGYHLGFNLDGNYFYCWRCGWHPVVKTLSALIKMPEHDVAKILRYYSAGKVKIQKEKNKMDFQLPQGTMKMTKIHRSYLEKRGFDPEKIESEWNVLGTGPYGKIDEIDYKYRIIIPFFWNGQLVTFDSRDVTNKHNAKYMACPKEREIIPHKSILYGKQNKWKDTGICVEGPFDVWRLGDTAFATSGVQFTNAQLRIIAKMFKRIAVMYDSDEAGNTAAKKLIAELKFRGVDAFRVKVDTDPGDMKQGDADYLVRHLIK